MQKSNQWGTAIIVPLFRLKKHVNTDGAKNSRVNVQKRIETHLK
jgi:hypothetical protein